jgi:outer membrane protein OmpA-like peptidoglycan-associated protein
MHLLKTLPLFAACGGGLVAQTDVKGSADHPLFPNRMPGHSISFYQQQEFSAYKFRTQPATEVEGKYTRIHYYLKNMNEHPGGLAIRRNYENAVKAAGGEVLVSNDNLSVLRVRKDGVELWAEVLASTNSRGRIYFLHIVEKKAMAQVITANVMTAALDKDGFIALDVHFATAKAEILPESRPLIDEAAKMLKARPALRVGIEGHTDDTGTPAGNLQLSDARAKSVTAALIAAGIDAKRLTPAGFGQTKPVADNRSEAGRAKNRRVEIVKKN